MGPRPHGAIGTPADPSLGDDERAELDRLRQLPWTRVVTASPGGGFTAQVRELSGCSARGASPQAALDELEHELATRLVQGARGQVELPEVNFWDPHVTEFFPVPFDREVLTRARALAEAREEGLGSFVANVVRTAVDDASSADGSRPTQPAAAAGAREVAGHDAPTRDPNLLDRVAFPAASSPSEQWQRLVMDRSIAAHLAGLGPRALTAAEISGTSHAHLPWKEYTSLEYPDFDLCAPTGDHGVFDVVICEQVLEHVQDPSVAARTLHDLCSPGGQVVVSTPFLIRVHELRQYGMADYWRFTPRGLATLLERAGLIVDEVADWGNRLCVLGNLRDWSRARRGYPLHREPDIPVQVWAFARRPTSQ